MAVRPEPSGVACVQQKVSALTANNSLQVDGPDGPPPELKRYVPWSLSSELVHV
jgi:hypothetical protein